jgi:hypothetical protein
MLFLAVKAGIHTHTETVGSVGHPLRTEGIFKLGSIDPNGMLIGVYSYFVVLWVFWHLGACASGG